MQNPQKHPYALVSSSPSFNKARTTYSQPPEIAIHKSTTYDPESRHCSIDTACTSFKSSVARIFEIEKHSIAAASPAHHTTPSRTKYYDQMRLSIAYSLQSSLDNDACSFAKSGCADSHASHCQRDLHLGGGREAHGPTRVVGFGLCGGLALSFFICLG